MKVTEIKQLVERQPFRPFTVRLNNGAQYTFATPRDLGAPKDYHVVVYFGESQHMSINTESITEIIEQ